MVDASDRHHLSSVELLEPAPGPLLVPVLVIPEVAHLLVKRLGGYAERGFLAGIVGGQLELVSPQREDWTRIAELTATYEDLGLGIVDASVIAAAERLGVSDVATTDRRHFTVVRARRPLRLLP